MKYLIIPMLLILTLSACHPDNPTKPRSTESNQEWYPGFGITYGGRVGIEVAPGIVMRPGGGFGMGFGF